MEIIDNFTTNLQQSFGVQFLLSPIYLGSTILIAWIIWCVRGKTGSFISFLVPRDLYLHASTRVDIKLALFNTFIASSGVFSALWLAPSVTVFVQDLLSQAVSGHTEPPVTGFWRGCLAAVLLFLVQDFCRYLNHYLHHETRTLWPFHAVHHSAEVLTPITFLRAHPMYSILQRLLISVLIGAVQGLILFSILGRLEAWIFYAGATVFSGYIFFAGHLRHSHIWLSYGPVLEHILISPAQHQIHHSSDPKHHDKNYGEVFAIWDWMFGTLYVPKTREELTFGIADGSGVLIEQPHTSLKSALVGPFVEIWEQIASGTSFDSAKNAQGAPDVEASDGQDRVHGQKEGLTRLTQTAMGRD